MSQGDQPSPFRRANPKKGDPTYYTVAEALVIDRRRELWGIPTLAEQHGVGGSYTQRRNRSKVKKSGPTGGTDAPLFAYADAAEALKEAKAGIMGREE